MKKCVKHKCSFPCGEISFLLANLLSAIGIALQVKANLGVSMVAAPAYLLSEKLSWLTFGGAELAVQGFLFLLCCLVTRKFVYKRLLSFVAAIPYSWILDFVMELFSGINLSGFIEKIALFLFGSIVLSLRIALYFRSYLPCQVYEMFVKCIAEHFSVDTTKVKSFYDWSSFTIAGVMSLAFFHGIHGIGIGTLLCTVTNAPLIRFWGNIGDKRFTFAPLFPKLEIYLKE